MWKSGVMGEQCEQQLGHKIWVWLFRYLLTKSNNDTLWIALTKKKLTIYEYDIPLNFCWISGSGHTTLSTVSRSDMGTTSRETPATGQATSNYSSSLMPGFPSPTSGTLRRVSSYVTPLCISPTTRSETEWVMGIECKGWRRHSSLIFFILSTI